MTPSPSSSPIPSPLAALEALLFIHGEPLSYAKIQTVLGIGARDELAALIAGRH